MALLRYIYFLFNCIYCCIALVHTETVAHLGHGDFSSVRYNGLLISYNGIIIRYNGLLLRYNRLLIRYSGLLIRYKRTTNPF